MNVEEKQYLSTIYLLRDLFVAYSSINITEEYPQDDLVLPTIAIVEKPIYISPLELGNRYGKRKRGWIIEVFAQNRQQRDSMTSTILDAIEPGIPVYNYDLGFPPSVTPPQIGALRLLPDTLIATPTTVLPELVEKLYWRTSIKYLTEYESIT